MRPGSNHSNITNIKFGSSKNLRMKMTKINKNIHKLHSKTRSNWSKKDLNSKYLLNGANFRDTYNRSTHTLFDHLKTQQINTQASASKFQGVITGNPYSDYPINNISKKTLSSKSSIDLGKSKLSQSGTFDNNTVKAITLPNSNSFMKHAFLKVKFYS